MKMLLGRYLSMPFGHYVIRPHKFIYDLYREIRTVIRRGIYGWDYSDTWSFDCYLEHVIYHALKYFQENRIGHPANITDKQWGIILNDIISGFEDFQNGDKFFMTNEQYKLAQNKLHNSLDLMKKYWCDLWD